MEHKFLPRIINIIKGQSLKWKLLFPFLFFALAGSTVLTYIGLTSQEGLIKEEEKKGLLQSYRHFLEEIGQKKNEVEALATVVAENPEVQDAFANRDREALIRLLMPTYVQLKMDYDIEQFHFHLPGAVSFLRLHQLERYGDDMSAYRKTIMDALRTGKPTGGLEVGATGYGIRGVAPVFRYGKLIGTVEIGNGFDEAFLNDLHRRWGMDFILYAIKEGEEHRYRFLGKAGNGFNGFILSSYLTTEDMEEPLIRISPEEYPDRAILLGTMRDYSGHRVALVGISTDRSQIQQRLLETRLLMYSVGLACMAISFLLTYLVASLFVRPIKEIARKAHEIAQEKTETHLEDGSADEIGSLTRALNAMLDSLNQKRREIETYARTLEVRVRERTADLVASEDKYRTLVENVPLIVYRVLRDGTTEFINSYLTENLGYTIEEAVSDRKFWTEKICGNTLNAGVETCISSFGNGGEHRVERQVRDKEGRLFTFIDHAIPSKDTDGKVKYVDGIMMDITALKQLQERALRAEEIRLLGEISAHMAHEIRNPLISVGGFARRLRDALPADDAKRKVAQIIVDEVARLESFLRILFSSIRPFDLSLKEVDMNGVLRSSIVNMEGLLKSRSVEAVTDFDPHVHPLQGDAEKLHLAFENLMKHAIVSTPRGEKLFLYTHRLGDRLVITFRHKVSHLSDDDLDKFFFPHIEEERESTVLDLPFARVILHRHGGSVDLVRENDNVLVMTIKLPVRFQAEGTG
jgi:PAS domain S-box-containing protein